MGGCRPAASTHQGGPGGDESLCGVTEVGRVARIAKLATEPLGQAGIGLNGDRQAGGSGQLINHAHQDGGTDRAVSAQCGHRQLGEHGSRLRRILAAQRPAVVAESQLGDHRQVTLRRGYLDRLHQGLQIAESLQDQQVNPVTQRSDLLT